jgi:hypothetical protein
MKRRDKSEGGMGKGNRRAEKRKGRRVTADLRNYAD